MAYLQEQTLVAFVETMLFLEVDPWNGQEELQPCVLVQTATTTRAWSVLFSGEDQTDRRQGAGWSNKLWQRGRHQQRSVFGVAMVRSGMRCSGMHAPVISKQGFLGVFSSLFWNFERKLFYI